MHVILGILAGLAMIVMSPIIFIIVIIKSIYEILRDGFVEFANKGKDDE